MWYRMTDRKTGDFIRNLNAEGVDRAIEIVRTDDNQPIYYCHHKERGYAWPVKREFDLQPMREVYMGGGWCVVPA